MVFCDDYLLYLTEQKRLYLYSSILKQGECLMHLLCKCGCDMWNGEIPNDIEFWVYSDKTVCGKILETDTIDTVTVSGMYDYSAWRCPKCGRVYLFEKSNNEVLRCYKPEDE